MSKLSTWSILSALPGLIALVIGTTGSAGQDTMPISVSLSPSQGVTSVRLFLQGHPQATIDVPEGSGGQVAFDAPVPTQPAVNGTVSADFPPGTTVSFPIIMGSAVPRQTMVVELINGQWSDTPSFDAVEAACSPQPVEPHRAFAMFFACRDMALSLDRATPFRTAHKTAINGWLKANFFFVRDVDTEGTISSFGPDAELLAVLERILQIDPQGRRDWAPLRFIDIQSFVRLARTFKIRLAGQSPDLLKTGRYQLGLKVNSDALETLKTFSAAEQRDIVVQYGIDRSVLQGNQALFENLAKGVLQ